MHEPDFWTNCADAMEMSIEGDRLIVREVADLISSFFKRAASASTEWLHGLRAHRHLPPL